MVTQPEAYLTWRDRVLGHLTRVRPYVRKLLGWAKKQPPDVGTVQEQEGARHVGLPESVASVSYVLFEGIKHTIADTLLSRARACES